MALGVEAATTFDISQQKTFKGKLFKKIYLQHHILLLKQINLLQPQFSIEINIIYTIQICNLHKTEKVLDSTS